MVPWGTIGATGFRFFLLSVDDLLFLLLLLANADFSSILLTFGLDMGGHVAVAKPPTDGRIWEGGAVFFVFNGLYPVAAIALCINGAADPTQKTAAVFGHERTIKTGFDCFTLHEKLQIINVISEKVPKKLGADTRIFYYPYQAW
jgi:hypothetical protein